MHDSDYRERGVISTTDGSKMVIACTCINDKYFNVYQYMYKYIEVELYLFIVMIFHYTINVIFQYLAYSIIKFLKNELKK